MDKFKAIIALLAKQQDINNTNHQTTSTMQTVLNIIVDACLKSKILQFACCEFCDNFCTVKHNDNLLCDHCAAVKISLKEIKIDDLIELDNSSEIRTVQEFHHHNISILQ